MLEGSFPNFVNRVYVDRTHFIMSPPFQAVYETPRVTSMNHFSRHWHLYIVGAIARILVSTQFASTWNLFHF